MSTISTKGVEINVNDKTPNGDPEALTESQNYLQSWKLGIVITSLCLGTFLLALDMNIIGVAIPKITTDFNSLDDIAWYGSVYLLTVTAFQPLFGNLYKYFNPKAVYLSSIALFEGNTIVTRHDYRL